MGNWAEIVSLPSSRQEASADKINEIESSPGDVIIVVVALCVRYVSLRVNEAKMHRFTLKTHQKVAQPLFLSRSMFPNSSSMYV